jgi:hypothetical protein
MEISGRMIHAEAKPRNEGLLAQIASQGEGIP